MANYSSGTVTIVEGSNAVVGTGTLWTKNIRPGQYMTFDGLGRPYQVGKVVDDTHLLLTRPISMTGDPTTGFTLVEQTYTVIDSFSNNLSIPLIGKDDINKQPRMKRMMETIDKNMGIVLGWQISKA